MYSAVPIRSGVSPEELSSASLAEALGSERDTLLNEELILLETDRGSALDAFRGIERPHSHVFHANDQRAFGLAGDAGKNVRIGSVDVFEFFVASRRASRMLRDQHIRDVVHGVRRRKLGSGGSHVQVDRIRRETAVFRRLRPWYPRAYLCLFDSLALIEFLARRRLYPLWVFGVQAQPFGAHCWVQANGHLLNEGTEYTAQFTPIMSV